MNGLAIGVGIVAGLIAILLRCSRTSAPGSTCTKLREDFRSGSSAFLAQYPSIDRSAPPRAKKLIDPIPFKR